MAESENTLKYAKESFAETIALKVKQLRRYVPKQRERTNTEITGVFIEELVRGFIRGWIGHKQVLHGTFFSQDQIDSGERPLQIDGIVYDSTRGPTTLREGDFVVVHPAFCSGVVEIKMTAPTHDVENRLLTIFSKCNKYFHANDVMAIIIADKNPEKASRCPKKDGTLLEYHNYACDPFPVRDLDIRMGAPLIELCKTWVIPLCPVFVLFKELDDGDYEPYYPAIESMIRAIYSSFVTNPTRHALYH